MSDKKLVLAVDFVGVDKMSATARILAANSTNAKDKIQKLKDEVSQLNKGLSNAKALRAASDNLKKHKAAAQAAAEKLSSLKDQIVAGQAPTKALVKSIQSAEKNLSKLQEREKQSADTARQMVASMRDAGVDVARLGKFEEETASKTEIANRALARQKTILDGNTKALKAQKKADFLARKDQDQASSAGNGGGPRPMSNIANKTGQSVGIIGEVLSYAKAPIEAGAKFESLMFRLRVLGLSEKAVNDLVAYANSMDVAGSSRVDNLRYLLEAQGTFREAGDHTLEEQVRGAKIMAPLLARLMTTMKVTGQELSPEQERYFLRFIDQAGGVNDPKIAATLTNDLFKTLMSSGGNLAPSDYQQFLSAAGTAGMRLSPHALFADLEPIITELQKGAGVGLATAYSRANGMVKNQAAMRELIRLGAWDSSKIIFNKVDGIKAFKNGENPLIPGLASSLNTDPVGFYMEMQKRYAAAGVKDVQRENLMLFGNTGGKLFNLIDKQLPTILKSRSAYEKTMNLTDAHTMVMGGADGAKESWIAAVEDWKLGFSEGVVGLRSFSTALGGVTSLLKSVKPIDGSVQSAPLPSAIAPTQPANWKVARFHDPVPAVIRPATSAAPAASSAAPLSVTIHAAPGQSEDAIAQKTIDLWKRQQATQARHSYDGGR